MIDRYQLEKILKINGVMPDEASEDEIKAVLETVNFTPDEITSAISLLQQKVTQNQVRASGKHKILSSEQPLNSKEISELLNIEVDMTHQLSRRKVRSGFSLSTKIIIAAVSIILGISSMILYMYTFKMGFFYPGQEVINLK